MSLNICELIKHFDDTEEVKQLLSNLSLKQIAFLLMLIKKECEHRGLDIDE